MKKHSVFLVLLPLLVLTLASTSYAWQGRMGGMSDPYGLVADESDFLIHPAKIANGEGVRFYGDYRFTYTGVTEWDNTVDLFDPSGVWVGRFWDDVSGEELGHSGLVGAALPLGPGRMGLFFTYQGMRGDYDGHYADTMGDYAKLEMKNDLDNFALRLLYGLPIGGFKLGAEAQFAYCQELEESNFYTPTMAELNFPWMSPFGAFLPNAYMWPHKSRYWEALFKGSTEGKVGPLDLEFTLRGGFDFGGTDRWSLEQQLPPGNPVGGFDMKGDAQGWLIGGDLWLRYPLAKDLTLPLLVRVDYQEKTRDGNAPGWGLGAGEYSDYKDEAKNLAITVGGGVDKTFGKATRIAAGIYYNYLQGKENFSWTETFPPMWERFDYTYPYSVEHQLLLRLAGEYTFSPAMTLRGGFSFLYGWVTPKMKETFSASGIPPVMGEGSGHGYHWGIGASLGGTVQVKPLTLEPFIAGGYDPIQLQWNGESPGVLDPPFDQKLTRSEWFVTTGLSILYDL
jgi:hypothetical protein